MKKQIMGMSVPDFCKKYDTALSSTYKVLSKGGEEAVLQLLIHKTAKEIKKDTPQQRQSLEKLEKIIHDTKQKTKKEVPVLSIVTLALLVVTILITLYN